MHNVDLRVEVQGTGEVVFEVENIHHGEAILSFHKNLDTIAAFVAPRRFLVVKTHHHMHWDTTHLLGQAEDGALTFTDPEEDLCPAYDEVQVFDLVRGRFMDDDLRAIAEKIANNQ